MTRTEGRLNYVTGQGTAYAAIGTAGAGTAWSLLVHVTNRSTGGAAFRCYAADSTWSTGEPTGSTLKAAWAYDTYIGPGEILQFSGVYLAATEKVVVRSSVDATLDITLQGLALT